MDVTVQLTLQKLNALKYALVPVICRFLQLCASL